MRRKYDELQSRTALYEELFKLLQSMPEEEAQTILRKIRSGADVETLVGHVKAGNLLLQLALVPETRLRYKFPYISKMPTSLLTDNNPYLHSLMYEAATIYQQPQETNAINHGPKYVEWPTCLSFAQLTHAIGL